MENTAIICETNPFHSGHGYLLDTVKGRYDGIVTAVMSGNFVQRGEPAVLDKYKRAEILLKAGADLVVELPFPWCAAGGEAFAAAGVAIASALGARRLAFGSETGDETMLSSCAEWLDSAVYQEQMRRAEEAEPEKGAAFLHDMLTKNAGYSLAPNDKLGVWYIRQIRAQHADLEVCPIQRIPYSETVSSASQLRKKLRVGESIYCFVPPCADAVYREEVFTSTENFTRLAWAYFRLFAPSEPAAQGDRSGLYRHLVKIAQKSVSPEAFFKDAATKKYTDARIRRTALFAMTGTPEPSAAFLPAYSVLLGAGKAGREYLRQYSRVSDFSVQTKPADREKLSDTAREQYVWLEHADRLYTACMDSPAEADIFMKKRPVILP